MVPTRLAMTPPRSMSPTSTHRHVGRLGEAHVGDVAVAQVDLGRAAGALDQHEVGLGATGARSSRAPPAAAAASARDSRAPWPCPSTWPCTITCAPISLCGFSSTGFMCTDGATPQARACSAWARPISPPSAVTAALFDMFCGLNGRTRRPCRVKARHSPATISDLPTSEPVPWNMMAAAGHGSELDPRLRLHAGAERMLHQRPSR